MRATIRRRRRRRQAGTGAGINKNNKDSFNFLNLCLSSCEKVYVFIAKEKKSEGRIKALELTHLLIHLNAIHKTKN